MNNFYEYVDNAIAKDSIYWGFHLLVDAKGCDKSTVNSGDTIKAFLTKMVDKLKMIPVGEPLVREFNDDNGRGSSGIYMITTSHFSAHCDDDKMSAYIDVFSCEKYDPKVAIAVIKEFFNPREMKCKFILRNADGLTEGSI